MTKIRNDLSYNLSLFAKISALLITLLPQLSTAHGILPKVLPYSSKPLSKSRGYSISLDSHHVIKMVPNHQFAKIKESFKVIKSHRETYFDVLVVREGSRLVLYVTNSNPLSIDYIERDDAWNRRKELNEMLIPILEGWNLDKLDLKNAGVRSQLILDVMTDIYRLSFSTNVSRSTIIEMFFRNSQKRFNKFIEGLEKGNHIYDAENYTKNGIMDDTYSHIQHFGAIYWEEIKVLKKLLEENPKKILTVLDLGAGGANFILTAAHMLSKAELERIKFIAIDLGGEQIKIGKKMMEEIPTLNAVVYIDDVTDPGFINRFIAYQADYVVVNHVLEHLPGKLEDYLHQWILGSKKYLSVSVPLGEELDSTVSDHCHSIDEHRIVSTAKTIEERINHTAKAESLGTSKHLGLWNFRKEPSILKNGGFSGKTFTLRPEKTEVHHLDYYDDFKTKFNPERFKIRRRAPKIGTLKNRALFSKQGISPRQVRQLPIKMPRTAVKVPMEFEQFREAIQIMINHNAAVNPHYKDYYVYLNVFRGITKHSSYRGLSLSNHGDQLQGLDEKNWYNPDYSYIVSNTLPTTLYEQNFDFSEAIKKYKAGEKVNLYDYMNAQAKKENAYYSDNYGIYLLNPYIVHSASLATKDIERVFIKVAFSSKKFYDNREERRNPAFDYEDWYGLPTIGYVDGGLQHAHYNERIIL